MSGVHARIENCDTDPMSVDGAGSKSAVVPDQSSAGCGLEVPGHLRVPIERDVLDCVIVGQGGYRTRRNLNRCRLPAIQTSEYYSAQVTYPSHQMAVGGA